MLSGLPGSVPFSSAVGTRPVNRQVDQYVIYGDNASTSRTCDGLPDLRREDPFLVAGTRCYGDKTLIRFEED